EADGVGGHRGTSDSSGTGGVSLGPRTPRPVSIPCGVAASLPRAQDAVPRGGGPYSRGPFLSFGTPGSGTSAPDTAPPAEDGGGLSPATGAAAPLAVPTPGGAGDGGGPRGEDAGDAERPGGEPDAPATRTGCPPPGPLPADFAVTTTDPTLDDLNAIVHLLVATPAPDEAKAHVPGRSTDLSARPQRGRQIYAAAVHRRDDQGRRGRGTDRRPCPRGVR